MLFIFLTLIELSKSDIISLTDLKSKLKNLNNSYTTISSSSLTSLTIQDANNNNPVQIIFLSGTYAGYQNNLDFMFQLISSIQSKWNTSDFETKQKLYSFTFIPVLNEPAYNAMYENYNKTGQVSVYMTDQSALSLCNTSDAGVNPNHNFPGPSTSLYSYNETCSQNYSGNPNSSIAMVTSLMNNIQGNIGMFVHLHLDKGYVGSFMNNSDLKGNGFTGNFNKFLSGIIPKSYALQTSSQATGMNEFGTLMDYISTKNISAVQIGVANNTQSAHEGFFFNYLSSGLPSLTINVSMQVSSSRFLQASNSSNNSINEPVGNVISIRISAANSGALKFDRANFIIDFAGDAFNLVPANCSAVAFSETGMGFSKDCKNQMILTGANRVTFTSLEMLAFGNISIEAQFNTTSAVSDTNICNLTAFAPTGGMKNQSVMCTYYKNQSNEDGGGGSGETGETNIQLGSNDIYVIAASCTLIGINFAILIVGVVVKLKNPGKSHYGLSSPKNTQ